MVELWILCQQNLVHDHMDHTALDSSRVIISEDVIALGGDLPPIEVAVRGGLNVA